MASQDSLSGYFNVLESQNADLGTKFKIATKLRDTVGEFFIDQHFPERLTCAVLPILAPDFASTPLKRKLRRTVLQILYKLPVSSLVNAQTVIEKLLALVPVEKEEENVIMIIQTLSNILSTHTETLEKEVRWFLDSIQTMFGFLERLIGDAFDTPTQGTAAASAPCSLKVLSECATALGSFELGKSFVTLIQTVLLRPEPEKAHTEVKEQGIGTSRNITSQEAYDDFMSIKVKFIALLQPLLQKGWLPADFLSSLPAITLRALRGCPHGQSKVRMALMKAIRGMILFVPESREIFFKIIDELLSEEILVGDGTLYEPMRPFGVSTLGDFLYHVRDSLSESQLRRAIEIYTENLHANFPGTSLQTMSARVLFELTECVSKLPKQDMRHVLIMTLNAIGDKFAAMNRQLPTALAISAKRTLPAIEAQAKSYMSMGDDQTTWGKFGTANATPIANRWKWNPDPVVDNKLLISVLMDGLKDLFYQLGMTVPQKTEEADGTIKQEAHSKPDANRHELSFGYTAEELRALTKLFCEGIQVFRYYGVYESKDTRNSANAELAARLEEREKQECGESFTAAFEIFSSEVRMSNLQPEVVNDPLKDLESIADPTTLGRMQAMAAILKTFNAFLPVADILPILTQKALDFESALSLYREPLIKRFNRCPEETCSYFAPKVKEQGRFLALLLAFKEAEPLRKAVARRIRNGEPGSTQEEPAADFLSNLSLREGEGKKVQAQINAIHIIHSLCQFKSTVGIMKIESLRDATFKAGKDLENHLRNNDIDPYLRLAAEQAGEQVIDLLVAYLEQEPRNFEVFFEIVEAVTSLHLKSTPAFNNFIYQHMIEADAGYWKAVTLKCIDEFANHTTSWEVKTFLFHYVVNPILHNDARRNYLLLFNPQASGTALVDKDLIDAIRRTLWKPNLFAGATIGKLEVERSMAELLQMTVLLLKYHTNLIRKARKDIAKFLWSWVDEPKNFFSKHVAFVAISYFIAVYDDSKTLFDIEKIYRSLLESNDSNRNECRALVCQALDVLAPVLTKRMARQWVSILETAVAESNHLEQLKDIFNFLARHRDLLCLSREFLTPLIISALHKITQVRNRGIEDKKLALNLISTIWFWQESAQKECFILRILKRKVRGTHGKSMNDGLKLTLIGYLFWFIMDLPDRYPGWEVKLREEELGRNIVIQRPMGTCRLAVRLLHNFLRLWADMDIDVFVQRFLEPAFTENPAKVLNVIVNSKPDDWILERMGLWNKLMENLAKIEHVQVQECLHDKGTGEEGLTWFNFVSAVNQNHSRMKGVDLDKNCAKKSASLYPRLDGVVFHWPLRVAEESHLIPAHDPEMECAQAGVADAGPGARRCRIISLLVRSKLRKARCQI